MKTLLIFSLLLSSCSFSLDRSKEDSKITIEEMQPLTKTNKINCELGTLTQLEIAKCKMEAKLLELKY